MDTNKDDSLLMPHFQDSYWARIDPDIRLFLDEFESRETWTYTAQELPDLFVEVSNALPKITSTGITEGIEPAAKEICSDLISLLSQMPIRQCISAISWLDRSGGSDQAGWGVRVFAEACSVVQKGPSDPRFVHAKLIRDRVKMILSTRLSASLFMNIGKQG